MPTTEAIGKEEAGRIEEKSRSLVSKCLESGISVVMLTQRPAQNAIPVKVRDQFLYRLCLYVASEGTAKVALGDSYFETIAPINPALLDPDIKGQGVLFAHGASTLIRGFNFEDEFMWDVVDEVHARQQMVIEQAPESPLKQAIDLMRSAGRRLHGDRRSGPGARDHGNRSGRARKATVQAARCRVGQKHEGRAGLSAGRSHRRHCVRFVTVTRYRQVTATAPPPGTAG